MSQCLEGVWHKPSRPRSLQTHCNQTFRYDDGFSSMVRPASACVARTFLSSLSTLGTLMFSLHLLALQSSRKHTRARAGLALEMYVAINREKSETTVSCPSPRRRERLSQKTWAYQWSTEEIRLRFSTKRRSECSIFTVSYLICLVLYLLCLCIT